MTFAVMWAAAQRQATTKQAESKPKGTATVDDSLSSSCICSVCVLKVVASRERRRFSLLQFSPHRISVGGRKTRGWSQIGSELNGVAQKDDVTRGPYEFSQSHKIHPTMTAERVYDDNGAIITPSDADVLAGRGNACK